MTKLNFAPAELRHSLEISALVNSAYRGDSSRAGWTTEADILGGQRIDAQMLAKDLADPNQKILCAFNAEDGTILGCVALKRFEDSQGVGCYFGMLTVNPKLQAAGLGKQLLSEAEDFARRWGAKRMTMTVIQVRQSLIAWYERRGYKKTGATVPFPYGDPAFGEPLRDDLFMYVFNKPL